MYSLGTICIILMFGIIYFTVERSMNLSNRNKIKKDNKESLDENNKNNK